MKSWMWGFALIIAFGVGFSAQAEGPAGEEIFERYKNAIVKVGIRQGEKRESFGTGFFISNSGEIVTNHHVVEAIYKFPGRSLFVQYLDGSETADVEVKSCGDKRMIDLCLLKVNRTSAVWFTPNSERIPPGERVFIIGHPIGFDFSITDGMVSGTRRSSLGAAEVVQVSAPISGGNSGGPIFNAAGVLRGVATYIDRRGQNLNFGVSAAELSRFLANKTAFVPTSLSSSSPVSQVPSSPKRTLPPTSSSITFSPSGSQRPPASLLIAPVDSARSRSAVDPWVSEFRAALLSRRPLDELKGVKRLDFEFGRSRYLTWIPAELSDCQRFNWMDSVICLNPGKTARLEITRVDGKVGAVQEFCEASDVKRTALFQEFREQKNRVSRWKLEATYPTLAIGGKLGRHLPGVCRILQMERLPVPAWFDSSRQVREARFVFSGDRLPGASSQHSLLQADGETSIFEVSVWTSDNQRLSLFYALPGLAIQSLKKQSP